LLGTKVFRGTQNFEPSRRICPLPRNFYVFTEFCGILYTGWWYGAFCILDGAVLCFYVFLCFYVYFCAASCEINDDNDDDKETNMAYFDGVQAAVLYVWIFSPWNTWLSLRLWWEEYWKYWAELIWNIAGLFGRQTVSVSCNKYCIFRRVQRR